MIRWNSTFEGWTISGKVHDSDEITRFISKSDVLYPTEAINWMCLPNGIGNDMVAAPTMHVKGLMGISIVVFNQRNTTVPVIFDILKRKLYLV